MTGVTDTNPYPRTHADSSAPADEGAGPTAGGAVGGMWSGDLLFMGVDGEMSSADLADGGRLIQAGFATVDAAGTFVVADELISWDEMAWSSEAAAVHQLPRARVDAAPRADVVDERITTWLAAHGGVPGRRLIVPVGLNVAGFDMPFFKHALPATARMMSRRSVDLNAILFTYDGWDPNPKAMASGCAMTWRGWKRAMKRAATERLEAGGVVGREHDAGYDAALALAGWMWLREKVHGARELTRAERHERLLAPYGTTLVGAFGEPLLARLASYPSVTPGYVQDLVAALEGKGILAGECAGSARGVSEFLGRRRPDQDGQRLLDFLERGDLVAVLAYARALPDRD